MKRYPIVAKIAGSTGILSRCVLNDVFNMGVWTFARFVGPLLAAILCVRETWSDSNNPVCMHHAFH